MPQPPAPRPLEDRGKPQFVMKRPIATHDDAIDEGIAWGEFYAGNGPRPVFDSGE